MRKKNFKILNLLLTLTISFSMLLSPVLNSNVQAKESKEVKNVILLIPDGTGITHTTLARWYKGGAPLAMDEIACGLIRTYSSDAVIADSAPAGTAMATGFKSHTGFIGVLPDVADMPLLNPIPKGEERRPVATVLESAKLKGKATGLVATSEFPHATPASFASHYPKRSDYNTLSEQMVYNNVDVVLAGGYSELTPEKRSDKEDLIKVLKERGYGVVRNNEELTNFKGNKVWGLFAPSAMPYDKDRTENTPSMAAMAAKAINILSKNKEGFFLMVEGSKIDWASHANDPVGVATEVLAFDNAVKVALDFAKKDKNTVVIVAPDHSNGGMSIGDSGLDKTYDNEPLSTFLPPLKAAKLTGEGLESKINSEKTNIKEVMSYYYAVSDLTDKEEEAIKNAEPGKLNYTVGPIISKRAHIGWTTTGHSGEEVGLYVYHPKNARLSGVVQNTDIAKYISEVLGTNLNKTTKTLFLQADKAFKNKGALVTVDSIDKENLVLIVSKGDIEIKFPQNKDIAIVNGKVVKMPGVTVYTGDKEKIDISKWYVSQNAVDLIK
ncbi:alkaline phosphatase [uncultured Clostridium sp.]|uniref:alkaline phosphatase n=1 Tax=uncultured Clostridium sp. TaxID=59620 RepID=UPI0028E30010|nr:alkaline phosphatase [uncultured Clostridium sp.]